QRAEPSRSKQNVILNQSHIVVTQFQEARQTETDGAVRPSRNAVVHFHQFRVPKFVILGERRHARLLAAVIPDQIESALCVEILNRLQSVKIAILAAERKSDAIAA